MLKGDRIEMTMVLLMEMEDNSGKNCYLLAPAPYDSGQWISADEAKVSEPLNSDSIRVVSVVMPEWLAQQKGWL